MPPEKGPGTSENNSDWPVMNPFPNEKEPPTIAVFLNPENHEVPDAEEYREDR